MILLLLAALGGAACSSSPKPEGKAFISDSGESKKGQGRGSAFVSPHAKEKVYHKVAVMPFRAPVELAGASVADMFSTELLKTYKYELVERSQMEQVLGEQELGLKGVTESALAMRVGKMLNVQGVIVGTVPEYGLRAVGSSELPAVGINVRMIDVETGSIVWSVTDSAISKNPTSISAFTQTLVESMIFRLKQEWIAAGDTFSVNMPRPEFVSYRGDIRGAVLELYALPKDGFPTYRVLRGKTKDGPFITAGEIKNSGANPLVFKDEGLLDAETYYYKAVALTPHGLTSAYTDLVKITTTGPPSPVAAMQAKGAVARSVPLSWTPVAEPEVKGYYLFRAESRDGPFKEIAYVKGRDAGEYVDKGGGGGMFSSSRGALKDLTEYFYKAQAVNVVDVRGPYSPVASAVTKPVPQPVEGLAATQFEVRRVTLTWSPNPEMDIDEYEVFRGESPDAIDRKAGTVKGSVTRFVDDRLDHGTAYFFRVRAVDKDNLVGPFSRSVVSMTKARPVKPSGLAAAFRDGRIVITWAANPEDDIARYEISKKGFLWSKTGESAKPSFDFHDTFKSGEEYTFRVMAVDAAGLESDHSDPVTVKLP